MWWTRNNRSAGAASRPRPDTAIAAGRPLLLALAVICLVLGNVVGDPVETREWEWIIIHHSATRVGSASIFDAAHRARGMINGLAYHFVIDNGTDGKADGF